MQENDKKAFRFKVTGRVQGVAYRYYAQKKANELGVNGWIRNLSDGSVEGVVEGEEDAAIGFITWCKEGPRMAIVESIDIEPIEVEGFTEFSIKS